MATDVDSKTLGERVGWALRRRSVRADACYIIDDLAVSEVIAVVREQIAQDIEVFELQVENECYSASWHNGVLKGAARIARELHPIDLVDMARSDDEDHR